MNACSAPTSPPPAKAARVQLLAQSPALRTALRRALAPAGGHLSADGVAEGGGRPDAVVLDTSLPGLHGLKLLRQITTSDPGVPVIVVALDTAEGRSLKAEAMRGGAAGFVLRPDAERPLALRDAAEEIVSLIDPQRATTRGREDDGAGVKWGRSRSARGSDGAVMSVSPTEPRGTAGTGHTAPSVGGGGGAAVRPARGAIAPQLLVVASSTGGPQALIDLFRRVSPAAVPLPVLVVQHMPAAFTPILAQHLSRATSWCAREALDDEPLTAGEIRIAPGGYHLVVASSGSSRRLRLTAAPPVNFCRPSADVLFTSAAEAFGRNVLAVILTGMGNDGAEGAKVIAAAGGVVFAQDRETSVVWGMPGAAVATGMVNKVLPLDGMAQAMAAATKGVL